jgi:hypothetical protein
MKMQSEREKLIAALKKVKLQKKEGAPLEYWASFDLRNLADYILQREQEAWDAGQKDGLIKWADSQAAREQEAQRKSIGIVQAMLHRPKDYDSMTSLDQTIWVINQAGKIGSWCDEQMTALTPKSTERWPRCEGMGESLSDYGSGATVACGLCDGTGIKPTPQDSTDNKEESDA